ncbi:MAG: hypothetical protein ICV68_18610 [Pyrinomonadaceae bacterium]|nr:hypothetical protein [Pyrinomonadaceae bacterium]
MERTTPTTSTFRLFEVNADGSITQVPNVTVRPSSADLEATLDPFGISTTVLARGTKYKAVVITGAKDLANNPLDQNTTTSLQPRVWYVTVSH